MQQYNQKDHEWWFVHWYNLLLNSGDLNRMFLAPLRNLTSFLGQFADPNCLCYFDHDNKGIWFAAWFRPMGSAVEFALWTRSDMRWRASKAVKNLDLLFDRTLKTVPVIVAISRQPELEAQALKVGFHRAGLIPRLLDGDDAYIYAMTKESRADVKALRYGRLRNLVHTGAQMQ